MLLTASFSDAARPDPASERPEWQRYWLAKLPGVRAPDSLAALSTNLTKGQTMAYLKSLQEGGAGAEKEGVSGSDKCQRGEELCGENAPERDTGDACNREKNFSLCVEKDSERAACKEGDDTCAGKRDACKEGEQLCAVKAQETPSSAACEEGEGLCGDKAAECKEGEERCEERASEMAMLSSSTSSHGCEGGEDLCTEKAPVIGGTAVCVSPFIYNYGTACTNGSEMAMAMAMAMATTEVFFRPEKVEAGRTILYPRLQNDLDGRRFLPDELARSMPLSTEELPIYMDLLGVTPKSEMAQQMKDTTSLCTQPSASTLLEALSSLKPASESEPTPPSLRITDATSSSSESEPPPRINDAKKSSSSRIIDANLTTTSPSRRNTSSSTFSCHSSIESMLDFATSHLPNVSLALSSPFTPSTHIPLRVASPPTTLSRASVSCHPLSYPYLVYACHYIDTATIVSVKLMSTSNDARFQGLAVCHNDTSSWNPTHPVFVALNTYPGDGAICHWVPENNFIWA